MATEADVLAALRKRYCPPEWAFLDHVANATGGLARRTVDGMAMNLYPSRGLTVHGFEVKCHRSDWLREKRAPDKADPVARYCDFWWIVAGDTSVVKDGELPDGWGLIELHPRGLIQATAAVKREDVQPLDRYFMAAMLRKATVSAPSAEALRSERAAGYRAGHAEATSTLTDKVESAEGKLRGFERELEELRAETGIDMLSWWKRHRDQPAILEVMRDHLAAREFDRNVKEQYSRAIRPLRDLVEELDGLLKVAPEGG